MVERRTVKPSEKPKVVELKVELTGLGEVKLWGCPVCGRNGEDKKQIETHIAQHGGEG
jgi:hypothetical protein